MNLRNKYLIERNLISLIKRESSKEGDVKVCFNNSDEHEITKLIITKRLLENGYKVWTEVEFKFPYSGRSDVFAVKGEHCLIYEILHKESDKNFENKIKSYPKLPEIKILKVKTNEFNKEKFGI